MVRTRFSLLDVCAAARELHEEIQDLHLSNLYSIDKKTYLLKFTRSGKGNVVVIIESGVRMHTTKYEREKDTMPASFAAQCRKYLRNKRLVSVRQVGLDRIVVLEFHTGYKLICEFYAAGNIILTDAENVIVGLLRVHDFNEDDKIRVGCVYPTMDDSERIDAAAEALSSLTASSLREVLEHTHAQILESAAQAEAEAAAENAAAAAAASASAASAPSSSGKGGGKKGGKGGSNNKKSSKPKKAPKASVKDLLMHPQSHFSIFGPDCVAHALCAAEIPGGADVANVTDEQLEQLCGHLQGLPDLVRSLQRQASQGFIFLKPPPSAGKQKQKPPPQAVDNGNGAAGAAPGGGAGASSEEVERRQFFAEVVPIVLAQHAEREVRAFPTFLTAVDEYFSKIENQRLEAQKLRLAAADEKHLAKVKSEMDKRVDELDNLELTSQNKAELILEHADLVEAAIQIIRSAVASGMHWDDLSALIKQQQAAGHPVASAIARVKLETNRISLRLASASLLGREDTEATEIVDVDIGLSAHRNASLYFSKKKETHAKYEKTVAHAEAALESARESLKQKNKRRQQKVAKTVRVKRKRFWFEKFHWFLAPGGYVVVSGQSAQENELIVKRYLRAGDVYVHADVHGAASCVIKNHLYHRKDVPEDVRSVIPPRVLEAAGTATISRSAAWKNNIISRSWWVHAEQVSKTAPSGEYLPTGSFMIRGKKNFLNPNRLEMGWGLLFQYDRQSLRNHLPEHGLTVEDFEAYIVQAEEHDKKAAARLAAVAEEATANATSTPTTPGGVLGSDDTAEKEDPVAKEEEEEDEEIGADASLAESTSPVDVASEAGEAASPAMNDGVAAVAAVAEASDEASAPTDATTLPEASGVAALEPGSVVQAPLSEAKLKKAEKVKKFKEQQAKKLLQQEEATRKQEQERQLKADGGSKSRKGKRKGKGKGKRGGGGDSDDDEDKMLLAQARGRGKKGKKGKNAPPQSTTGPHKAAAKKKPQKGGGPQAGYSGYVEQRAFQPAQKDHEDVVLEPDEDLLLLEEGADADGAEGRIQIRKTHFLTGCPTADDKLLHCIPCAAPFALLKGFRYKVKLVPGKMKRGKACQQAQRMFLGVAQEVTAETLAAQGTDVAAPDTPTAGAGAGSGSSGADGEDSTAAQQQANGTKQRLQEEARLIKDLALEDMVMTMLGDVKLSISAAQLQKQKAQAKAAARAKGKAKLKQKAEAQKKAAKASGEDQPAFVKEGKKKGSKKSKKKK